MRGSPYKLHSLNKSSRTKAITLSRASTHWFSAKVRDRPRCRPPGDMLNFLTEIAFPQRKPGDIRIRVAQPRQAASRTSVLHGLGGTRRLACELLTAIKPKLSVRLSPQRGYHPEPAHFRHLKPLTGLRRAGEGPAPLLLRVSHWSSCRPYPNRRVKERI